MCVAGDEESNGGSSSTSGGSGGSGEIPEILVTAPRIGLDQEVLERIDWSDVATVGGLSGGSAAAGGGGIWGAIAGAVAGALSTIETQDDVDLDDLVEVKHDRIVIQGWSGHHIPLY